MCRSYETLTFGSFETSTLCHFHRHVMAAQLILHWNCGMEYAFQSSSTPHRRSNSCCSVRERSARKYCTIIPCVSENLASAVRQ